MDTSDADWGGWNLESQGEIDAMIDAYEQETDNGALSSNIENTDIKSEPLYDATNVMPGEDDGTDYALYDGYDSYDNSPAASDNDGETDDSGADELMEGVKTNGNSNSDQTSLLKQGMASCEHCGHIGIKHAFYSKSKRFCSLSCSRSYSNSMREGKLVNISNIKKESPEQIVPHSRMKSHIATKKSKQSKQSKSQVNSVTASDSENGNRSFEWSAYLKQTNANAAPVSCFKHCPMADLWDNITVGMKVEVLNLDSDLPNNVFWIATVIKIAGYKALMRYEGFGTDPSQDYWLNLCTQDVHPVGWCATIGKPLVPPKTIQNKYADWKDFLVKRLTGARTLPNNFYSKVIESMTSYPLKRKMKVEVVDKMCVSAMRVATVDEIIGGRVRLQYSDTTDENDDFWCHMNSSLLHCVGWAQSVGHKLHASADYKTNSLNKAEFKDYDSDDSRPDMFPQVEEPPSHNGARFHEGMKLEAIDPLNLVAICVATVKKVLRNNYLMIGIDGSIAANGSDWFCYHATSPCIFPVGFCEINNLELTPPRGYKGQFKWFDYLKQTKSIAAPVKLFDKEIPKHGYKVGSKLEAVDLMEPRLICCGTVTKIVGRLLRIHFDGWEQNYDQWIDCRSPDIYPVGWCELVGYHLEGPRTNTNDFPVQAAPPIIHKKRKTKNQIYRGPRKKKKVPTATLR